MPPPDSAERASSRQDQDTLVAEQHVCFNCSDKLNSGSGSTHRTTILRPLLNVAGTSIVASVIDQPISDKPDALQIGSTPRVTAACESGMGSGNGNGVGAGEVSSRRDRASDYDGSVSRAFLPVESEGEQPVQRRRVNSYDIIEEISRGSFGVVYKARQQGLDRVVALKVLLAGQHASAEAVARFHREAKAVARLKHPNIVPIYDIGTHDGHHYFAMEFVEGSALSALITLEKISISQALATAESLADAFHSAHNAGVIHRDIKPSNILIDKQGQPHITDFGLAKQVDLDTKYTMSGTTLGTPAYMPPEQARGEIDKIDARSDVYAIGAVLYEMLTGKTPFAGRSLLEVVVAVISEPVRPPRQLNPRIHRDIQTIVLKCLEKDPRLRYASAAELRDDLRRFRSGEAIRAKPAGFLRLGARFVRRQSVLIGMIAVVLFALGFSYARVQKSKQDEIELKRAQFNQQISKKPRWRPDWWFPVREEAQLNEEQRDYVQQTGNTCQVSQGFTKGTYAVWDLGPDGKTINLPAGDTMVLSKECLGDVDADIHFKIPESIAESGIRVGLDSFPKPFAGIPYLFEYHTNPSSVRIIGPKNLNKHTSEDDPSAVELEVKAEKMAPELDEGKYTINIHREGTKLSFTLMPERGSRSVSIAIDDLDLSNWVFKDTRLVFRAPSLSPAVEIQSVDVRHRDVPEEELGFMKFREGEYNAAEKGLQDLATRDDHFKSAQAYLSLGMIYQITHPKWWLDKKDMFQEGLHELDEFRDLGKARRQDLIKDRAKYDREESGSAERYLQEVDNAEREAQALATELRVRRIQRFAKIRDWKAVQTELKQGWPDRSVNEPLAWNLESVLTAAVQNNSTEDADAAQEAALALFQKLGLTAGSERLGKLANELGLLLSFGGRFDDMITLHMAYPSSQLFQSFMDGIDRAIERGRMVEGARLLKHIVAPARAAGQSRQLLAKICAQVDKHAVLLAGKDNFGAFTDSLLPVIVAYLPQDDDALNQVGASADKVARALVKGGRFMDLMKLHTVIRGRSPTDRRLAPAFAEAVTLLAAANDPESQATALDLLVYANRNISNDQSDIQQSAEALGRRRMTTASGDPNYLALVDVFRAYPAPGLVKMADEALHDMLAARRYEDTINFYQRARADFGQAGATLTPAALAALENVSAEQRERFMAAIWDNVHQALKATNEEADRAWTLEFGDMQMALGQTEKAHDIYETLSAADVTPEVFGKVSVRLAVLQISRTGTGYNMLTGLVTRDKMPEEVRMAAKLLSAPTLLSPGDLPEKLKLLTGPRVFNTAEWELLCGIRLFADQKSADAQTTWNNAIQKGSRDHSWVTGVASQLLRLAAHGPSEEPAPVEKPDPEPKKN